MTSRSLPNRSFQSGETSLLLVQELLKHRADVNYFAGGRGVLHVAVVNHCVDIVELLPLGTVVLRSLRPRFSMGNHGKRTVFKAFCRVSTSISVGNRRFWA